MLKRKKILRREQSITSSIRFVLIFASFIGMAINTSAQYMNERSKQLSLYDNKVEFISNSVYPMLTHALLIQNDNMLKAIGDQILTHPEVVQVAILDAKKNLRYENIKPSEREFTKSFTKITGINSDENHEMGQIKISFTKDFLNESVKSYLIDTLIVNTAESLTLILFLYWFLSQRILSPLKRLVTKNKPRENNHPTEIDEPESFLQVLNDIDDEIQTIAKILETKNQTINDAKSEERRIKDAMKIYESRYRVQSEKLDFIMKANELGSWELDVSNNEASFGFRWYEMLGISSKTQTNDINLWFSKVHKDDLKALESDLQEHITGKSPSMNNIHRLQHNKGHWIWVLCRSTATSRSTDQMALKITGTIMDVSDHMNAKEEALAANKSKSEFLANMSHEIRTPLNGVLGMASLLKRTQLDAMQTEFIKTIEISGKQLLSVISDILDLSKIEAGKFELSPIKSDIRSLIENVIRIIAPSAEAKGLKISSNISPSIPNAIYCDDTRLQQVLVNLLNNAVKFTAKGNVYIHADAKPSTKYENRYELEFHIIDEGIGIPQEQLNNLFKAFSQADATVTRKFGGTGLGLAISKQIIEMMSGSISVTSQVNRGSDFSFNVHLPTVEPVTDEDHRHTQVDLSSLRVLIAEDTILNQKVLYKILRDRGIIASIAANGVEATHLATTNQYDLIFMDLVMPEMDGIDASKRIIAHAQSKNHELPKFIAISASFSPDNQKKLYDMGVTDLLEKPVTTAQVDKILQTFTSKNTSEMAVHQKVS